MTLPFYRPRSIALSGLLSLCACSAAAPIVATVGGVVCAAMQAILGPSGEYWGSACDSLVKFIAAEIAADTTPAVAAARARTSCTKESVVPVPGFESAAQVCPGLEAAAARGAAKAVAASKAAKR